MLLYILMAVCSAIGLLRNSRLAFILSQAMAPTGALLCFIALFSGAFWGRPTWGTYWVWDARLTSALILFFLYLDAPIDPDTSLSTQNALGNVDIFSMPTTRSFGISLKASF